MSGCLVDPTSQMAVIWPRNPELLSYSSIMSLENWIHRSVRSANLQLRALPMLAQLGQRMVKV